MGKQSAEYFQSRERSERSAAAAASSPAERDIHLEMAQRYAAEAEQCRREARRYEGKPEQQFLLRVATCFDELAVKGATAERSQHRTARQEVKVGASTEFPLKI